MKYALFQTQRDPFELAEKIRLLVHQQGLADRVLRVRWEKGARKGSPYYAFLALDKRHAHTLSADLTHLLGCLDLRLTTPAKLLEENQVSKMLSKANVDLEQPDPALPYRKLERQLEPVFGQESEPLFEGLYERIRAEHQDQLLYWLSAAGSGTWPTFLNVCQLLRLAENASQARQVLRQLSLLGHLETSQDGQRWAMAPTTAVCCDVDGEVYLAGQRQGAWLEDYPLKSEVQAQADGPARWLVTRPEERSDWGIAEAGAAAREMLDRLPDLRGWKASLTGLEFPSLSDYDVERWNGTSFETAPRLLPSEDGFYRLTPLQTRFRQMARCLYFDSVRKLWLQADWSGLRLLADIQAGAGQELIYDAKAKTLTLRADQRWPLVFEKALVLASGRLPSKLQRGQWLKYHGVSNALATDFALRFGADLSK